MNPANKPPITEEAIVTGRFSPTTASGKVALAWDIAKIAPKVAAIFLFDISLSLSIIFNVAKGAAKLTKSTCKIAKTPNPGSPKKISIGEINTAKNIHP